VGKTLQNTVAFFPEEEEEEEENSSLLTSELARERDQTAREKKQTHQKAERERIALRPSRFS
jgi:hypothetical protein